MNYKNIFIAISLIMFLSVPAFSEAKKFSPAYSFDLRDTSFLKKDSSGSQKDLADIARRIFHKQRKESVNTNKAHISALPAAGYSLQTGWAGVFTTSISFCTDAKPADADKISSLLTSITYSQYKQILFPVQANIWMNNSRFNIVTDWRYLKYPSTTYGLGPSSKPANGYSIDYNYLKLHQTFLVQVYKNCYAGLGYYYDHFWNIREVDPPAGQITSFEKYGLIKTITSSGIAIKLLYDSRLNQVNPKNGYYINAIFRPNFIFLGSNQNWESQVIELRKYFHFPAASNNILAFWNYNWFSVHGKTPYLLLPSTGWDDFYNVGRGYIQGRYRDNDMIYFESEYRVGITHNGLLGAVAFANAQSFSDKLKNQLKDIAPGYGIGVRIKVNKFSNTNLCIDYGFGNDRSRGIAINLGEVF